MVLFLCAFAGFFLSQLVKMFVRCRAGVKIFLALVGSAGAAAVFYYHHPSYLAVYAVAGAGLAVLVHRVARLSSVAGDWVIHDILRRR